MPHGHPLHLQFERFECKYLLSEVQARAMRRYLAPYLETDPFAAQRPDGRYRICSLYLDAPDLRLHRETIEGIRNRYKLRIRAYSDDPADPVFLEIKRRTNQVIRKQRCPITRSDMVQLLNHGHMTGHKLPPASRRVLDDFVSRVQHIGAVPMVMVNYEREACHGTFDPGARVTFDRQIRCQATDEAVIELNAAGWTLVEGRRVVLELKFNGRCPSWMANAIREFGLHRISFSKYSNSLISANRSGTMLLVHRQH